MAMSVALARAAILAVVGFVAAALVDVRLVGGAAVFFVVVAIISAAQYEEDADLAVLSIGFAAGVALFVLTHTDLVIVLNPS